MSIIQQPMGAGNGAFTYQDLVTTIRQDAWTTVVYFPGYGGSNTILCENSILNPAIQWCAPKASTWEPPAYVAVVVPPVVIPPVIIPPGTTIVVPPYVPPPRVVTPEPSLVWITLFIIFVIILLRGPSVWRNHREGR